MNKLQIILLVGIVWAITISCSKPSGNSSASSLAKSAHQMPVNEPSGKTKHTGKIVHVLVALCDNLHQGIVPVPARLGNGEDLQNNLYWGAAYGVKAFFTHKDSGWQLLSSIAQPTPFIKPAKKTSDFRQRMNLPSP